MVRILDYEFEGPYSIGANFNNVPGIYVIYTLEKWLDVGETDKLGQRIPTHERKNDWINNANGKNISLAFLRINDQDKRLSIESYLRDKLNPVCGER